MPDINRMKYETPKIVLTEFLTEDIITDSSLDGNNDNEATNNWG